MGIMKISKENFKAKILFRGILKVKSSAELGPT